jgi:hypothetical protein
MIQYYYSIINIIFIYLYYDYKLLYYIIYITYITYNKHLLGVCVCVFTTRTHK